MATPSCSFTLAAPREQKASTASWSINGAPIAQRPFCGCKTLLPGKKACSCVVSGAGVQADRRSICESPRIPRVHVEGYAATRKERGSGLLLAFRNKQINSPGTRKRTPPRNARFATTSHGTRGLRKQVRMKTALRQSPLLATTAVTLLLAALTTSAYAQDWAKARLEKSPRHLEWVKVKQGEREVNCFLAFPEVKEKATAVVVIHEIFGLTDWVRGVADQLAEAGYIAIAPDLLSGTAPGGGGTAELGEGDAVRKAISSLPQDQVTADLNAVTAHVTTLPAAN